LISSPKVSLKVSRARRRCQVQSGG